MGKIKNTYHHTKETTKFKVRTFLDFTNKRLKVTICEVYDYGKLDFYLKAMAMEHKLSKIIMAVEEKDWREFFVRDYTLEALHPTLFRGKPGYHMSKFLTNERRLSSDWKAESEMLLKVRSSSMKIKSLPGGYDILPVTKADIPELAGLYEKVFVTYPTEVSDKNYIEKVMQKGAVFKTIKHNSSIVSAASLDINNDTLSAELTDCATLPGYEGKGLMSHLLSELEEDARSIGLITVYTIARACSFGINAVFLKNGYKYYGRFINNCDICGRFEDMNLWSKQLQ